MTFAIEAHGLTKRYRGFLRRTGTPALQGLDLCIPQGSAFGLIGPNGAGKTTFIKSLLGVVRPDSGSLSLLGGSPEDPAIRARIGYLPERLHLPYALTPVGFLHSVARLKGLPLSEAQAQALLERVGLGPERSRKLGGFSKGMKQRAGLAAALLGAPELLVLDEPTDGIDPMGRVDLRRVLGEELSRGATLFLNSHLLSETERVCTRVGILAGGKLVREGPLEALRTVKTLWQVRFAPGAPTAALAEAGFHPVPGAPGTFELAAEDAPALNAALDRARAHGALLVQLQRASRDLEAVLADALGVAA